MIEKTMGIIVTFNPDVDLLVKSLERCCPQLEKIYIIDNNSDNYFLISKSTSSYNNIHLHGFKENIGLAKAQNYAIELILNEKVANYIILFDQDSIISNGFINCLISDKKKLEGNGERVGAIGPSFFDPESNVFYPATVFVGPFIKRVKISDTPTMASYLIASGCLIECNILRHVGLMKDELFIDYIDIEWSMRAQKMGYKLFISSTAKMAHTIGDQRRSLLGRTVSVHSAFRRYFLVRNSFFMLRQNYVPVGYKVRELTFNILRFLIALIFSKNKRKILKSYYYGCYDGIRGVFGPLNRKL